ncbi:HlyD family efflux transporter periplasmic adaptor subunit [Brevibacillus fluminis]|uniref:HlyD family efflux transporter periplasmic adaptor subunit n=1 Tax=Brevibacillus fluminis TaxID=511487 RepID=A0A3M8DCU0_9BACL|nr:efflux RND transporter periplasmic adaptor subunit [Brevibacillus fluminis]RNB85960.1 HlyD family efflux transporter periplasmic adaptor subunit [Brevibacillus fluminis]
MSKKKWIIISSLVVVLGGGGYGGYHYWKANSAAEEPVMEEKPQLPTVAADTGEVKKTIYSTGTVEAKAHEEVKSDMSTKVERILVKEGQHVSKGTPLFTFDSADAELQIQKQEIALSKLERDMLELGKRKDKIVSDKKGKIKEIMVKAGETVSTNQVIAKVIDMDHLKIVGKFYSVQSTKFQVGQQVRVFLRASLTYTEGIVTNIDQAGKKVENAGVLYDVEVLVKKDSGLGVGDIGQVEYRGPNGEIGLSQIVTKFEFPEEMEIVAGTEGKVSKVLVKEDDAVQPGQTMVEMDMEASDLEKKEKEINLKEAQLDLIQKKRDLSKKQVTATVGGVVTKINAKEGEQIDGSKPAMVIMDMSSVYMKASVDEVDIPYIQVGQTVDVYVTAFGNQVFKGKVVEIPQEGTTQDKTVRFEVKILIADGGKMKHGMTGDCDINVNRVENVVRLPVNAVEVLEEGKGTVMVKDPNSGELMPKEVEIGIEGAEFIEIKSGVKAGDEVMVTGGMG